MWKSASKLAQYSRQLGDNPIHVARNNRERRDEVNNNILGFIIRQGIILAKAGSRRTKKYSKLISNGFLSIAIVLMLSTQLYAYSGYPKIASWWANYNGALPASFYAKYDIWVQYSINWPLPIASQVKALNSDFKILITGNISYGDPLAANWASATRGAPEYNYLMRDPQGDIINIAFWNHPMYNLTQQGCRDAVVQYNLNLLNSGQNHDGLFLDRLHSSISGLCPNADYNQDGIADSPDEMNALWLEGIDYILSNLKTQFPNLKIVGNDAEPKHYQDVNGTVYENYPRHVLDENWSWSDLFSSYYDWTTLSRTPYMSIFNMAVPVGYRMKYAWGFGNMPSAMYNDAGTYYQRARFGITTTLMGNGEFTYDLGDTGHGHQFWFDENDNAGQQSGYLGEPISPPYDVHYAIASSSPDESLTLPIDKIGSVKRRDYQNGLAVVNSAKQRVVLDLNKTYQKINGPQSPLEKLFVDDGDAQFTGSYSVWMNREATVSEFGNSYREASANGDGTLKAVWRFTPYFAGDMNIYAWINPKSSYATNATYTILQDSQTYTNSINQTTGSLGWKLIGTYNFLSSKEVRVELANKGTGTYVLADAIKLESIKRYNDGSFVNKIILDAQDGIVLLGNPPTLTPTPIPSSTPISATGTFNNTGFESGDFWGWRSSGSAEAAVVKSTADITPPEGLYMCGWSLYQPTSRLQNIFQKVTTVPGHKYTFKIKYFTSAGSGNVTDVIVALAVDLSGGQNFLSLSTNWNYSIDEWKELGIDFIATRELTTLAIRMGNSTNNYWNHVFVDDARLEEIITEIGDCNCDGNVTPGDALLAFNFYLLIAIPNNDVCNQALAADFNSDGNITPADALCIFRKYLNNPC